MLTLGLVLFNLK